MKEGMIKKHLRKIPLFTKLLEEELQSIVDISQMRTYKARSFVFMQGDPLDRVFFIHSGKVKIQKTDTTGREQIVSVLQAGEMFPHAGFFRKGTFPANAEILEIAQLIVIPIGDFENILLQYPQLCITLFKVLEEKIVDLQNRLEEKILHDMNEQIIMLLLRLCKSNGIQIHDKYKLTTQFTNRELANMIGTSRETISRTINQLKRKKLIDIDENGFFIIIPEKLQEEIA
ncbi:Crp/Fnr family transcriptional regulator [Brevibacillus laterosporus]|uniref:Crp/Fnr family transcriptional regulator n=1 Tax=Brevibacillus laterosporus TaxID=1465 RepID=UPI000364E5FD|nr:Crp/Fnr family transcriptional regulator [Brevibacillus laterosporus]ATO51545.1 Crp/Fnr family transcriptional regulator [Brevibacillus laterosporus DSM 25]MBG9805062.1 Crp/Fnr family transcriptional regulator [Brevibacillus laterosporus]MED2004428.1 Crp/Fnr family transcriptional regulator [Brevibacillus laterosporus]MED4764037.1 Crp/Fnr family transcriptional regulator [Brevibacillus laterosporus]TPH13702.1 Crp/Fnr family transcriptional regulator [Brevibacillus laterosporus]